METKKDELIKKKKALSLENVFSLFVSILDTTASIIIHASYQLFFIS